MQILVAEDDRASAKLLVWLLQEQGYEAITCRDGAEALRQFKTTPTRIVISDWMMPVMDGLQLCQEIRDLNLPAYTHFLLLTARTDPESFRRAMLAGIDDFLPKSVNHQPLIARLHVAERMIQHEAALRNQLLAVQAEAEQDALHDPLTGLPNRLLLRDRLNQARIRSRRQGTLTGVVMLDVDDFKLVNAAAGLETGDTLLRFLGDTLRGTLRESDTICRWGGDELLILLPDLPDRAFLPVICTRIHRALRARIAMKRTTPPITVSMGFSVFPEDSADPDLLIRQAEHSLYQAKADGGNCWREFIGFTSDLEPRQGDQLQFLLGDFPPSNIIPLSQAA